MRPQGDWVLVQSITTDRTPGGILLPDRAQEESMLAKVLAVGPGRRRERFYLDPQDLSSGPEEIFVRRRVERVPVNIPVGAVVLIPRWAGYQLVLEHDRTVMLLREDEVLAVMQEAESA